MAEMKIVSEKLAFEENKRIYESVLLTFKGVDGWDVYNCSLPFTWKGQKHMFGRVEKRAEWANSHVRLFVETAKDEFTAVPKFSWELEDPYVQKLHGEFILGGTHVRKNGGAVLSYYGYFYRGTPFHPRYYTTGPDFMKDIRTVQLADGRIGVFSRRRDASDVYVGFTIVDTFDNLSAAAISEAKRIDLFEPGAWGGVNHPYLLSSGKVGCIAHYSYKRQNEKGTVLSVYMNYSFVFDVTTREVIDPKIIGTKACYPAAAEPKIPALEDCVFTTGIVMREDGRCDLYSGVGDTCQGRLTIDYPFEGHGAIVGDLDF